ncbi:MAG: riboflavin synthase [Candidatus Caenarcaniphilales bacterium]|nr:riboflavin synthase [Candidatus Caenarcaniphilales bacterium]
MFTGIIQEIGKVTSVSRLGNEMRFVLDLKSLVNKNLELGESVAINGACHTIEELNGSKATFFSSQETLKKTNLRFLRPDDSVNLELSLTPSTRMGGHFVSGHIDGLAKLLSVQNLKESYLAHFEIPSNFSKYLVNKGSICLNGISLTIANKESKESTVFSVAVIPHTWQNTNLQFNKVGHLLNCEVDMLAKYIENLVST